jgi:hypothetical protein
MEEKTGKEPAYPEQYAHVEQLVNDTQETVRQMDARLQNLPADRGPEPHYSPPGFLRSRQPGSRDATAQQVKAAREALKADTFSRVEKDTKEASPELRAELRDKAREALFPNPYRKMTGVERDAQQGISRDIEQAQDYMDALRHTAPEPETPTHSLEESQERMNAMRGQVRENAAKENPAPEAPSSTASMSASARFTQTLHRSPGPDKQDTRTEPARQRDAEMDRD